jgi:hypothetical protein
MSVRSMYGTWEILIAVSTVSQPRISCESNMSTTIKHGIRKSDKAIVPVKQANKTVGDNSGGVCGGNGLG